MGLVLAYDFDHKLDLLRQHFPCSDKIILSTHFFVFLKVPYSSYEKKMIIINMKKQSSHIAYITSSAFYVFCDLYFYYVSSEHQYTYTSIVNSPLQCTFLQMFYAANLCHTCLVPTPFKSYHQSASEKSRYIVIRKFWNFFTAIVIVRALLVLNRHKLKIGWAISALRAHF